MFTVFCYNAVPAQLMSVLLSMRYSLEKDVDGVTCLGFWCIMAMGEAAYGSATPAGIMTILKENNIEIAGEHAVVVGHYAIFGSTQSLQCC